MLDEKIADALDIIESACSSFERPVVMSSFGKDSMVMLDLIKRSGRKLPLIFHRETAALPRKFSFANEVIEREGYTVYDYMPSRTAVVKAGDDVDIVSFYQIGPHQQDPPHMWMPAGIEKMEEGKPHLCALHDFYQRPTGTCQYWWDVTLVGHKDSDENKWLGKVPLNHDIAEIEGGTYLAFPIRAFTDADVWEYIERFHVPFNEKRYRDHDLEFDNDHYPACTRCLDRDEPATVHCPKLNRMVPNFSASVRYYEMQKPHYMR
jgi:hypothetical protein